MLLRKKGDPINPTHQRRDDEIEGPGEIESQNLRHVIIELGLNSTVTRVALVSWSISDRHRFQPKPKKKNSKSYRFLSEPFDTETKKQSNPLQRSCRERIKQNKKSASFELKLQTYAFSRRAENGENRVAESKNGFENSKSKGFFFLLLF